MTSPVSTGALLVATVFNLAGVAAPQGSPVPHHQSELLADALREAGVPVTLYTVLGGGHGQFDDPKVPELTKEFLAQHRRPLR